MHDKNLTPNILAAFAAGRHLRTKDAGDPIEMLASKFADFSDAAMKRLDNAAAEMKGVRANFDELEQKMARGGNYEPMRPETWGAQFIDIEGSAVKSLSEHGSGKVSLMVKTATTAQTSVGVLEVPTRDTAAMLPQRRLTIRNLLPVVSISTGSVEYVQQETRASGAAMVAEGAAKPESNMTLALKTTSAKVIAHWMKASRQALDDLPQLRDLIDNDLRYGLALTEETQILTGDGTGQNLLGLIPSATEYADPLSVANPTMVDVIGGAILQSALADFPADGIVIHPADWTRIRLLKDGDGKYLMGAPADSVEPRLFGLPVVATKAMGVGQFLVGSFAEAATLYDRWAPRVEVGYVNDDFTNNLVTILAEERLAMAVKQPLALTYGSFGG